MMTVQDRVHELLAPIVATLDVELVDVEFTGGTLRVIVDSESNENPDDGITTKALADVNRLISPILDQHDPVPGRYTLEVSSPGLERPLKRTGHYQRAIGEQIVVKLAASSDPRRVKGRLLEVGVPADADADVDAATDAEIVIEAVEIDGIELDEPEERRISTSDVATARTVFDWGPSPKPGKSRKKSTAKNTSKKSSPQKKKQKKGSSTPGTSQEEVRDEQ